MGYNRIFPIPPSGVTKAGRSGDRALHLRETQLAGVVGPAPEQVFPESSRVGEGAGYGQVQRTDRPARNSHPSSPRYLSNLAGPWYVFFYCLLFSLRPAGLAEGRW
ncbi:synaptotagmin-12 [Platysternon megacephalum]|uniref:Synaptotagmin-12 n=1 Tax=Platysternon megacephalum TaxID=55544 RepID=A0A4D9DS73_9SAUR|nr:synaptotagmin-12 [Platysternon megacephalum]